MTLNFDSTKPVKYILNSHYQDKMTAINILFNDQNFYQINPIKIYVMAITLAVLSHEIYKFYLMPI